MSVAYEIGPFRLEPEAGVLMYGGMATALGARAVAVLNGLVERAHEYVPKARLIDAAWPHVVVEEANLSVQIAAIRRVLAQAGGEHWIETLARRGYRFVGPVKELREDRAAECAGAGARSNLPAALTSFIGREREVAEIKRLLASRRLVTVTGVGGIGKTRLALEVAAEIVDAYRDGVWLIELESIRDPSLVATTVSQALGLQERAGRSSIESLRAHLKSRQVLLILDNCEHLLDACAQLVRSALGGAKDATIIATSREPLQVPDEQVYPLQSLSLPELGSNVEATQRSEAVELFVERVQQQVPSFELTEDRAPAVAEVCVHLDGIPLALELAAVRTRSLSVEQINDRLRERFRLLTGGLRTALPRQQTMRATLDWSYDLLGEDERVILRRLSVFPGTFSVEATVAVATDAKIDDFAVIDLLSQLVARSLVVADTGISRTRYRLLETTRAYALEKLAEVGESDAIKLRHAEFFRDLFDRAPDDWLRMSDREWHAAYAPELVNVRSALDWALGSDGNADVGVRLAGCSGVLWSVLGLLREGARWLEAAIARISPDTPESDQARLWLWLGRLVDLSPARALPAFERAVELYRRLDDDLGLGIALARLGRLLTHVGRFDRSAAILVEGFRPFEHVGPPRLRALYFANLAYLKQVTGDLAAACANYEQALALDREVGAEFGVLATIGNLANVRWAVGDLDSASTSLRELVALLRNSPFRTKRFLGFALMNLAGVLAEHGDVGEALAIAAEGLPLVRDESPVWLFYDHVALRAALAGKLSNAARLAGCSDRNWTTEEVKRPPIETRLRARLDGLLRERLSRDELDHLLAEGAKMTEEEACRLALED